MKARIDIPRAKIVDFCRRRNVRRMAFFGSVLREDFRSDSDVDVLIDLEPDAGIGLLGLAGMEIELGGILGRQVEIHTVKGLNPQFRDEVLAGAESIYGPA